MTVEQRRDELRRALEAVLADFPDVVSPLGVASLAEELGYGDSWSADEIDEARRPHYVAAWALIIEHRPLDPDASPGGSLIQSVAAKGLSGVYYRGLLREAEEG